MRKFVKTIRDFFALRWVKILLGVFVSGVAILLLLQSVDLEQVWTSLAGVKPGFLALALLSVLINTSAKAFRWNVLIGETARGLGIPLLLKTVLVGQMLNYVLPLRIGDFSRAYVVGGDGSAKIFVFGTVVIEKVIDLLSYALLFLALLFMIPLPAWLDRTSYLSVSLVLLIFFAGMLVAYRLGLIRKLLAWLSAFIPPAVRPYFVQFLEQGTRALQSLFHAPHLFSLLLWTCLIWATALLTNHLTLLAFDLHLPLSASLLILVALLLGIALPSLPGKIGIFEYICVLALSIYGVDSSIALSYGLVLHAVVLLPVMILGLVFYWNLALRDHPVIHVGERAEHSEA